MNIPAAKIYFHEEGREEILEKISVELKKIAKREMNKYGKQN